MRSFLRFPSTLRKPAEFVCNYLCLHTVMATETQGMTTRHFVIVIGHVMECDSEGVCTHLGASLGK